jgi:hypothetical protein
MRSTKPNGMAQFKRSKYRHQTEPKAKRSNHRLHRTRMQRVCVVGLRQPLLALHLVCVASVKRVVGRNRFAVGEARCRPNALRPRPKAGPRRWPRTCSRSRHDDPACPQRRVGKRDGLRWAHRQKGAAVLPIGAKSCQGAKPGRQKGRGAKDAKTGGRGYVQQGVATASAGQG